MTTIFLSNIVNFIAYHKIFDDCEGLVSLHHLDVELSQIVIVDGWLNVSEGNEIGHPKVWRGESFCE